MKRMGRIIILVLISVSVSYAQTEILNNEKVIQMAQAGLNESLILRKIEMDTSDFDLSAEALVALKKAGVSDTVIEAMFDGTGTEIVPPGPPRADMIQPTGIIVHPPTIRNVSRIVLGKREALKNAKTIAIEKSSLHPSRQALEKQLFKRKDWRSLNLNIVRLKEDADLYIEIGYVSMSWISHRYVYRVYEGKSGTVIVAGETTSWGSLSKNLARGISKRLAAEMEAARKST